MVTYEIRASDMVMAVECETLGAAMRMRDFLLATRSEEVNLRAYKDDEIIFERTWESMWTHA